MTRALLLQSGGSFVRRLICQESRPDVFSLSSFRTGVAPRWLGQLDRHFLFHVDDMTRLTTPAVASKP
jgi:hypothetical protein